MSKTDKTRPWWVRVTERPMVTCVPMHRHEAGACTLPEDPAAEQGAGYGFERDRCSWVEGNGFHYGAGGGCGCAMCTGQVWRRQERRAQRHEAARVCREALRSYVSGEGAEFDFDDYVASRPAW